jgi:hypothetical protein
MTPPTPDPAEQKILHDIATIGWSLIGIDSDNQGPSFVYSIGMMQTLNHPEIIMFGLDTSLMATVINDIGDDIRSGRPFRQPGLYEGILKNFACKIEPVHEKYHPEYLGYAMWHRRHVGHIGTLQAVQCLWPDKVGLFPGDPGCDPAIAQRQPTLHS